MLGETTGRHAVPVITSLPERNAMAAPRRFAARVAAERMAAAADSQRGQRARICSYVNPVANRAGESVCILPPGHVTGHRFGSPDPDAWIYE